ncbi:MAG: class I SAM-dependent methyltransferase [Chloroflexi bacterium]|nr:class I SAM-dependent methyltransferase [Chloroflexota bacterium]
MTRRRRGRLSVAVEAPPSGEERLNRQREPLPTHVEGLPDLPPAFLAALSPVVAALETGGLALDDRAHAIIEGHVRLLLAWNAAINLTAITEPSAVARLHVADSLAALPLLAGMPHATLLDLGSGGGFPGLALAAALPDARVTLVESVGKKAAFLGTAIEALGLGAPDRLAGGRTGVGAGRVGVGGRVGVVGARAETLVPGAWDVVTARAVGSLADLVELGLALLGPGGRLLAWKRGDIRDEVAAGARAAAVLGGSVPRWHPHPPAVGAAAGLDGHGIVVVRKVARTPGGFPRDPAARARRPW